MEVGLFRHYSRVWEKKSEKNVLSKHIYILSSILSICVSKKCFVSMLDVIAFVKQNKLVQYMVWIDSIFSYCTTVRPTIYRCKRPEIS